jgi:DNA-binding PadR family transcriptional regulator
MNFLKPCLLYLLHRDEAYGYSLLDELEQFGFDREHVDPSLVYRALRDLEDCGWVTSRWGEESQGPRRRIYQILPAGEEHLVDVMHELRRSRDEIDRLLAAYEDHLRSAGQG